MTTRVAEVGLVSSPEVDLVFDVDCPHVGEARRLLRHALSSSGFPPVWREWTRDATDTPPALRGLGSPTILIDGIDVSTDETSRARPERSFSCRIYHHGDALRGVPPIALITRALVDAKCR